MQQKSSHIAADSKATGRGPTGKHRKPVAVILLCLVTIGVYLFVWYYKTNQELRPISGSSFSVMLWTLLLLVPVVGLMSLFLMANNVHDALHKRKIPTRSPPVLFLLLVVPLVNFVGIPLVQAEMNKLW